MNHLKKLLLSISLTLLSFGTLAAGSVLSTISAITALSNGYVLLHPANPITAQPACATVHNSFAVDGTTTGGKNQVAFLASAMMTGKTVQFYGLGTCAVVTGVETIDYVVVNN